MQTLGSKNTKNSKNSVDEATEAALRKVIQARSNLVLDECFFGSLALRLKLVVDPTCKTFWTDGQRMGFNPEYAANLSLAEVTGIICHEVMHIANGHPWRRDGRDKKQWNLAADFAIDPVIIAAKMRLPDGGHIDPSLDGLSAEQIYGRQQQPPPQQSPQGQDGGGEGEPETKETDAAEKPEEQEKGREDEQGEEEDQDFGCGEVRDCTDEDAATQEAEWQVATLQAAQAAKAQGKLPAGIERLVDEIRRPKIDWKAALRRFVQTCAKADYSWKQPNRRYIASGIYLPALRSEQMPPIVIYWDTSGSRDNEEARAECAAEVISVIEEVKPEKVYVIYGDTEFQHVDEFEPGDPIEFHPKGGGGTDFTWILKWIEENGIEPACLIGITDGYGIWPKQEPEFPTLWAMTTDVKALFGETLKINGD